MGSVMPTPPRLVIGLVGRKGSGKGKCAGILKTTYGASVYRFSDVLRDILDRLFVEKNRENLIKLSEVLRQGFGEEILRHALLKQAEQDPAPLVVLDGIRRVEELRALQEIPGFHLVNISAPLETRYARIKQRGENAGETTRTLESFRELEQASTEVTISDVEVLAERTVDNSGDADQLAAQIDELMTSLLSSST